MFNLLKKNQTETYQERTIRKINLEFSVDMMILSAWRDGIISDKRLSTYDRYLLEFIYLGVDKETPSGLSTNIIIYDQDLEVVYDAQFKVFKAINKGEYAMGQMLLELEYWLSLDWEVG